MKLSVIFTALKNKNYSQNTGTLDLGGLGWNVGICVFCSLMERKIEVIYLCLFLFIFYFSMCKEAK